MKEEQSEHEPPPMWDARIARDKFIYHGMSVQNIVILIALPQLSLIFLL